MTMSRSMDDGRGFRPGAVAAASSLAIVAGILTFALSAVFLAAMVASVFDEGASINPGTIITWVAVATQLVGSFLLLLGGGQLAKGTGRRKIVVGAGMLLLLLPAHLYYVEMELRRDPAEGDLWTIGLPFAIGFAVMVATILILAVSRPTTEYLRATST